LTAAPEVLLHPVIERFAAHSPGLSPSARRTLRTNLRFIARRVVPQLRAPDAPLGRERAKPPCTPAEIAGFLALAGAQPAPGRRMRASALICLAAGPADRRGPARRARHRCCPPLRRRARSRTRRPAPGGAGPGPLPRQAAATRTRRNVTCPLVSRLAGGAGLPALDTGRLQPAWLAETAALIGLPAFMRAAGITCPQRPGDKPDTKPRSSAAAQASPDSLTRAQTSNSPGP
jgi:hypothetical protein